jgi:CRP/FNR family transcriptional regulator
MNRPLLVTDLLVSAAYAFGRDERAESPTWRADARWLIEQDGPGATSYALGIAKRASDCGDIATSRYWQQVAAEIEQIKSTLEARPDEKPVAERRPAARRREDGHRRRLVKGETLFLEGDLSGRVFEIVGGSVILSRALPDGRRQILDVAGPGRLVGLSDRAIHDYDAIAAEAVVIVDRDQNTMLADPDRRERILRAALDDAARMRCLALLLGRMTAAEKLATHLLDAVEGTDGTVVLRLTRGEIADHLGLTIETVSRNFSLLKKSGLIEESRGVLIVRDIAALRLVANRDVTAPAA